MADYLPRYMDGDQVPVVVGAGGITGGRLIRVDGTVAGNADTTVAGVAAFDCGVGGTVTVYREGIHIGTASGTIALGDSVCAAAAGAVRTWVTGTDAVASRIGRAWSAATNGNAVTYSLFEV